MTLFFRAYLYAGLKIARLFLVGWCSTAGRSTIHGLALRLGFSPSRRPLPAVPPASLTDETLSVRVVEPFGVDGNLTLLEMTILCLLVKKASPNLVFEIGTFDGRTALNLAVNTPQQCVIHTLDLPRSGASETKLALASGDVPYTKMNIVGRRYTEKSEEAFPEKRKIVQHVGDSATFDYTPFEGKADVVFVDGAHSYDYAKNDSQVAMRLLKSEGGLIIWHDYQSWEGVTRALDELQEKNPHFTLRRLEGTSLVCLARGPIMK